MTKPLHTAANARLMRSLGFKRDPKPLWYGGKGEFTSWDHPMKLSTTTCCSTRYTPRMVLAQCIHSARCGTIDRVRKGLESANRVFSDIRNESHDLCYPLVNPKRRKRHGPAS